MTKNKEYSVNVYVITDSLNVPNYINNIIDKESLNKRCARHL